MAAQEVVVVHKGVVMSYQGVVVVHKGVVVSDCVSDVVMSSLKNMYRELKGTVKVGRGED